ncbi:hypothetical protein HMI49_37670 [Corallococcus exercitus]|uniref:Uncharacterized protein n=1 Tax=Corallococcus exercitus TaxID=2316736 RepID=A0A7Y4NVD8_9BACT|nr:hypothetical protein [Corallococcus exercitus]NOK38930.1 hypothetical protein [Corallococcus exercitus]
MMLPFAATSTMPPPPPPVPTMDAPAVCGFTPSAPSASMVAPVTMRMLPREASSNAPPPAPPSALGPA